MHFFMILLTFKELLLASLVMPLLLFLFALNYMYFNIHRKQDEQLVELRKNHLAVWDRIKKYSKNCEELVYLNKRLKG